MVDQDEAAQFFEKRNCHAVWLVNHGMAFKGPEEISALGCMPSPDDFKVLELHAKLLNGDLQFNEQQWSFFEKWVDTRYELLMEFIEMILLPLHPLLKDSPEYGQLHNLRQAIFK